MNIHIKLFFIILYNNNDSLTILENMEFDILKQLKFLILQDEEIII
jgi:hypothetical protein